MEELSKHLETFAALAQRFPGPVPWSAHFDSGLPGPHCLFSGLVHGNETGSLPALAQSFSDIVEGRRPTLGKVTVVLGNEPAARQGERFLDVDLNRIFIEDAPDSRERRRALELMPLLKSADLFIDFHQTTMPALEPFFIFAFEMKSYLWARYSEGAKVLITRSAKERFTNNSLCIDEYARQFGIPSLTLELGQAGINERATQTTRKVVERVLDGILELQNKKTTLETLALEAPDFRFLTAKYKVPFDDRTAALKPGLVNLSEVKKNEVLGKRESGDYVCPEDSYVMFPKYPKRDANGLALGNLGGELYVLLKELEEHPKNLWG